MQVIRIMSFNIFLASIPPEEIEHPAEEWANRAELNVRTIKRYRPDLIGLQEFEPAHWESYRRDLPEYAAYFQAPGGQLLGTTIFWNPLRLECVEAGSFWLSRTPEEPSIDWGADSPLTATWSRFKDLASGQHFLHLNTHLDDESELSRVESCKLIQVRIANILRNDDLPVILTGDFNCNPWSPIYRMFLRDGFVDSYRAAGHGDSVESSTFHGLQGNKYFALEWGGQVFWRVDWILCRGLHTLSCTIVHDAEPPIFPSDHYPVVTELLLPTAPE